MKGSAITGPVAKECVRIEVPSPCRPLLTKLCRLAGGSLAAYRIQRRHCRMIYLCLYPPTPCIAYMTMAAIPCYEYSWSPALFRLLNDRASAHSPLFPCTETRT